MHTNDILLLTDLQSLRERFARNVGPTVGDKGCQHWLGGGHKGYGSLIINRHKMTASRVAYVLAFGPMPILFAGMPTYVLHECDNPICVNPEHLFLGNHRINTDDMLRKNRQMAMLTPDEAEAILLSTESDSVTAKRFGIRFETVSLIKNRRSWKHIRPDIPAPAPGSRSPKPKLTADDVRAIRADTRRYAAIASQYGIGYNHVKKIRARRAWAKLNDR